MHKKTQHFQRFWVAGINYKKSDASVRGLFAVSSAQYGHLLSIAGEYGLNELFIISTCNRTEIYGVADNVSQLASLLCSVTAGDAATFNSMAYLKNGIDAVEHLFKVAAGLDSQILGDFEILGQIKNAARLSKAAGCMGSFTERLLNSMVQSSKAIRTRTALSSGTVSVSFAAIQCIRQYLPGLSNEKIVVAGTGKIGKSTCRNLVHYLDSRNITLINRTEETAVALADELGLKHQPMDRLMDEVGDADIIIVSTGAAEPILAGKDLNGKRKRLIIDLSVPCNVAPDVADIEGITLVNVDALSKINDETLEKRRAEVPAALAIIDEHIGELKEWYDMRRHVPVLRAVKEKLAEMQVDAELARSAHSLKVQPCKEQTIQSVINVLATKMRKNNAIGCNYIEAINDYIAYHV